MLRGGYKRLMLMGGAPALAPPTNINPPTIIGNPSVGEMLFAVTDVSDWTGDPTSFGYQWQRDFSPIPGEVASSYMTSIADQFTTITCAVVATNAAGSSTPENSNGLFIT